MRPHSELFGELRSLLHQPLTMQSLTQWDRLRAELRLDAPRWRVATKYLTDMLRREIIQGHHVALRMTLMAQFPDVTALDRLSGELLKMLLKQSWASELEGLDLSGSPLAVEDVQMILRAPCASTLRSLNLARTSLHERALAPLVRSRALSQLRYLSLSRNPQLGGQALQLLARSSYLRSLRLLDVRHMGIVARDMVSLLRSEVASTLAVLNLSQNREFADDGALVLAKSMRLGQLEVLELGKCGLHEEGARALATSERLGGLRLLRLQGNKLGAAGLEALQQAGFAMVKGEWIRERAPHQ